MSHLEARDVMHSTVYSVHDDWSLEDLARYLVDHEITGAPVVSAYGKLVGAVSLTDLARATREADETPAEVRRLFTRPLPVHLAPEDLAEVQIVKESSRRVRDVMTPTVYGVSEDTPVGEIAEMMVQGRIHRVFVTRDGEVVGVVSALDLLDLLTS